MRTSDYIAGPMNLHGLEKEIDVMIEAKCKEQDPASLPGAVLQTRRGR